MANGILRIAAIVLIAVALPACSFLLPTSRDITESKWGDFEQTKAVFDQIVPNITSEQELAAINIDPDITPNLVILNYLDIIQRFMNNVSITKADLDEGLQKCLEAKDACRAYDFKLSNVKSKRKGNFFLDLFRFRRETHTTGWHFNALIVMVDNVVVYKLMSGTPRVDQTSYRRNPLGILQDSPKVIVDEVL